MGFIKKKIAVFINGWSVDYIQEVLEGIRQEATKDGVDIFVFMTYILWDEPEEQTRCQLNIFHLPNPSDFDGAIVFTNTFNGLEELDRIKDLFQKNGVPMISTEVKVPGMAFVGTDNVSGMKQLTRHLVENHDVKDVVYLSGLVGNEECAMRKSAVESTLNEYNLAIRDDIRGDFSFANAMIALKNWLDEGNKLPDAFICANDHMALGVVSELDRRNICIPDDVLVTGFDKMREGRATYPILASVSRTCFELGIHAYHELEQQAEEIDDSRELLLDTVFVPSESCGCEPNEGDLRIRKNRVKNIRPDQAFQDLQDLMLQKLRLALSTVENKEEFHNVADEIMRYQEFFGPDFCICGNPWIFDDDNTAPVLDCGYNEEMDILYGQKDSKSIPLRSFKCSEMYPDYQYEEGKSNTYIFMPLNHLDMVIGYVAVKNFMRCIYGLSLRRLQADLNPTFVFIKQYIHAQNVNRKLKEIYMRDFLTGMYNRTGIETDILSFCMNAKASQRDAILVFADIDGMKRINDKFGHLNGDLAVKATAEAMRKAMPDNWLFGRYGGDEFVAVSYYDSDEDVENLRQRISDSIRNHISDMKLAFDLSVSVGCYLMHPEDQLKIEDYIRLADKSMYAEKQKAHQRFREED